MLRIGVIGIGNMGSEHCRMLWEGRIPEAALTAVADLRADRRAWAQECFGGRVAVFGAAQELISSGLCDAVIVAVPHPSHPWVTVAALEGGLHVLCEKPIAVSVAEARCMQEAAQRTGRTFALMFNQRTNGLYKRMKQTLDAGELGAIKRVSWIITDWYRTQLYYDSGSWRATWAGEGGGVLLNQCPHQLDLLQWLCGMPVKVQAHCHEGKWHDIEVEDDVTAYLEFANGATGTFIASTGDLPGVNRLEITCDRGRLLCEDGRVTVWRLPVSERQYCVGSRNAYDKPPHTEETFGDGGENPQHAGVTASFVRHILHGEPLVAQGGEGLASLEISNAIHLSGWLGAPVTLPIDEALFLRELNARRACSRLKDTTDITFVTDHSGSGSAQ
ncbi:MAG: Gfo/Idh/MocA family oxidoreductase [Clostridiales bacterium]|nr:Gfo/Idh/MocA family oxidoreductase [Clostridiales bacterium]